MLAKVEFSKPQRKFEPDPTTQQDKETKRFQITPNRRSFPEKIEIMNMNSDVLKENISRLQKIFFYIKQKEESSKRKKKKY